MYLYFYRAVSAHRCPGNVRNIDLIRLDTRHCESSRGLPSGRQIDLESLQILLHKIPELVIFPLTCFRIEMRILRSAKRWNGPHDKMFANGFRSLTLRTIEKKLLVVADEGLFLRLCMRKAYLDVCGRSPHRCI